MDLQAMTDADLETLAAAVGIEQQRRRVLATAQQQAEDLAAAVYQAMGGDGRPWVQPTGAHDAYPLGAAVIEGGVEYVSTHPANTWGPPSQHPRWWRRHEEPASVSEWDPEIEYRPPVAVSLDGVVYDLTHTHASPGWRPDDPAMHAVWKRRES